MIEKLVMAINAYYGQQVEMLNAFLERVSLTVVLGGERGKIAGR